MSVLLALGATAHAQTTQPTMSASIGFDGVFRPDNWTPVYVTLADADRRSGTLELRVAHGRVAHDVVARVVANPKAQTFTLYAPVGMLDQGQLQFRGADGKILARKDLADAIARTPSAFAGTSVGVAGEPASAQRVANTLNRDTGEFVAAGAIEARLLPERAIGYRAVDFLVVAGLDPDALDDRVEQAIVDWVRAGGVLVAWPGAQRPSVNSPLADVLPAEIGDVTTRTIDGAEHVLRTLTPRDGAAELSGGAGITFRRRLGLGQIVLTAIDPTTFGDADAAARLKRWRTLTDNEFSLGPDDRRRGVFDPLVAQSLAEQTVRTASPATPLDSRPWLWIGLVAGLLLGPAEIAMLLAARQHPRTLYTLAGLGLTVGCGVGLAFAHAPAPRGEASEVIVETGERAVRVVVVDRPTATTQPSITGWLGGDASDPTHQPAGAARVALREDRVETTPTWLADGVARPLGRSIEFGTGPASDPGSVERIAIVGPKDVRIGATEAGAKSAVPILADDPATVRVETGIERLAADPAWAAAFLDRTIASRLVRVQESEGATIVARRETTPGGGLRIVLRVER